MKKPDPQRLAEALELALPKNYLGDLRVVDRLLRDLAIFTIKNWSTDRQDKVNSEVSRVGQIFLGVNSDYVSIPGWNAPGAIDIFLFNKFPFDDSTPEARVACALCEFLEEATDLVPLNQMGESPIQLSAKLQGLIRYYAGLFVGMEESTEAKIEDAFPTPTEGKA
jgi:hypothetical protein